METEYSSETLVGIYEAMQYQIPVDHRRSKNILRRSNIKYGDFSRLGR
jgi:hypothetical protein